MSFPGFPGPSVPPGPPPTPGGHDILSSTHDDTLTQAPVAGDLIISVSGIWERLAAGTELDHLVIMGGVPEWTAQAGSGLGNVSSSSGVANNSIVRYDQTTGSVIQDSLALIDDAGNLSIGGNTLISGDITILGGFGLSAAVGDILYATGVDLFGNLNVGSAGQVLTVVGGVPAWAAASGGATAGAPVPVTVATTPTTTVINTDYFVAVSGAGSPQTINLTASPTDGERKIIKDSLGIAATGSITVDGNGSLIDNVSSVSLVNNFESLSLIFSATLGQWQLV